jgi:hypothetical protein
MNMAILFPWLLILEAHQIYQLRSIIYPPLIHLPISVLSMAFIKFLILRQSLCKFLVLLHLVPRSILHKYLHSLRLISSCMDKTMTIFRLNPFPQFLTAQPIPLLMRLHLSISLNLKSIPLQKPRNP